jgi:putative ABC transport system substrate-binding protein
MTITIGRRKFISALGSATLASPFAAHAQQPAMPLVGFLHAGAPEPFASRVAAFREGLSEAGFVEGRNVAIEFRWAQGDNNRLPELAADLVRRGAAVIAALSTAAPALAAKNATTTIPTVFYIGGDPVQAGLVASLNRPGGNVTGITSMNGELGAKQLGLLHELLPAAALFAVLVNPTNPGAEPLTRDVQAAAVAVGQKIELLTASTNHEIDTAFASLLQKRADAILVGPDALFNSRRVQLVTLATRHKVPAIYWTREFAEAGGLMSYGTSVVELYRQVGIYTGRILKGEKPADLPVMRVAKFEFVINLQTAMTLGIEIPTTLLARADEVIE